MEKKNWDIFKDSIGPLLLGILLPALVGLALSLLLLGPIFIQIIESLAQDNFSGADVIWQNLFPPLVIVGILFGILLDIFEMGIALSIYRKVRYDRDIHFQDFFYFFNKKFLYNVGISIVRQVLVLIGMALFVIPGIVASLGLFAVPIFLAENQEKDHGFEYPLTASWDAMKGYKLNTLGYLILFGIIGAVVGLIFGKIVELITPLLFSSLGEYESMTYDISINTFANGLGQIVGYIGQFAIFRMLITEGAFSSPVERLREFYRKDHVFDDNLENSEQITFEPDHREEIEDDPFHRNEERK